MRKLFTAAAVAIATLAGFTGYRQAQSDIEGWREIAWPFPRDGWPAGRAFRCATELCGDNVELYVRPKIGFCNCDSGVAPLQPAGGGSAGQRRGIRRSARGAGIPCVKRHQAMDDRRDGWTVRPI